MNDELPVLDPQALRAMVDGVPARATVVGRDQRYLHANAEFLGFIGRRLDEVVGRSVLEVLGEPSHREYLELVDRLFAGEAMRWEGWVDYPGRGRRYLREHLTPLRDAQGAVTAVVSFGRDLTELHASEALKASIVDNALVALVSTDAGGAIVEFNPAAEAMFARSREQVLGRPVAEVIIPEGLRAAHREGMARLAAGGAPRMLGQRMALQALRGDGREFPVEMVLWRTEVGGVVHYTASLSDLTERRDTQQQIERQREALRQSEKLSAMGSLLAGVAHELNNPLAIVMGRATLLEQRCRTLQADPALADDARRIREAAERCGRIVRTFLDMARQKPALRTNVSLNDLVRGAADLLQYNLRSGGIELELKLTDGLPPVHADADQLGQVVLNLLVNAQQALSAAPRPRRLLVETGLEPTRPTRAPRLWLRVADNGPGVAEAHRDSIFEPFFTTKSEGVGTGLGLSVSRGVVREHGGELLLEPVGPLGTGASFRMSVPLSAAPPAEPAPQPLAVELPLSRVLVVDDEPELASLMREVLESAGFEVASAESGDVALQLLAEARFDAVVSDLHMAGLDGASLWRELRVRHPALAQRLVFVTGDTLSPAAADFLRHCGCATLDKPFAPADLVARVRSLLPDG